MSCCGSTVVKIDSGKVVTERKMRSVTKDWKQVVSITERI